MKSWTDYETTEEAFEALRIMRGGEPTADQLAEKAGLRFGCHERTIYVYGEARDEGALAVIEWIDGKRPHFRTCDTVIYAEELEAILAKMREVQGG